MERKDNPLLISFSDCEPELRWHQCLQKLEHEYTLTMKDICKILKCSRAWFNTYIKPHLHYIYLSNGKNRRGVNYVKLASKYLNRDMTASTWYSQNEFYELITKHIHTVTRQTISIPIECLIEKSKLALFTSKYRQLLEEEEAAEDIVSIINIRQQKESLVRKYIVKKYSKLWDDAPSKYHRTETVAYPCKLPDYFDASLMEAVHDLKDYGDSEEEIYRELFDKGCFKICLAIPDVCGSVSEKVYYMYPQEKFNVNNSVGSVSIKYSLYQGSDLPELIGSTEH